MSRPIEEIEADLFDSRLQFVNSTYKSSYNERTLLINRIRGLEQELAQAKKEAGEQ